MRKAHGMTHGYAAAGDGTEAGRTAGDGTEAGRTAGRAGSAVLVAQERADPFGAG